MKRFRTRSGLILLTATFASSITFAFAVALPSVTLLQNGSSVAVSSTVTIPQTLSGSQSQVLTVLNSGTAVLNFNSPWISFAGDQSSLFSKAANLSAFMKGSVALGVDHRCAINEGRIKCWGSNYNFQFGTGTYETTAILASSPTTAAQLAGADPQVIQISAGNQNTCAVFANGTLKCWGAWSWYDDVTQLFYYGGNPFSFSSLNSGVTAVSLSYDHACAIQSGGVWCWGDNRRGQLGYNSNAQPITTVDADFIGGTDFPAPVRPRNSSNVSQLTADVLAVGTGQYHTCALKTDGTLYCWGGNESGQIGDNTQTDRLTPTAVKDAAGTSTLSGVSAIAAGAYHTCAIVSGALYCWGSNSHGQLGPDSSGGSRGALSKLPGVVYGFTSGVTAVAAGDLHTCAVQNESLYCWGSNTYGQLGNANSSSRGLLSAFTDKITSLAAGHRSTCVVKDGSLYCWGATIGLDSGNNSTYTANSATTPAINTTGLGRVNSNNVISLYPGGSVDLPVTFTPGSYEGTASATFSISSNDSTNPTYTVNLSGSRVIAPVISTSLSSSIVGVGANVRLPETGNVELSQGTSPSYQWQRYDSTAGDFVDVSSATSASYSLSNLSAGQYKYRIKVSNAAGTVYSNQATITVQPSFGGILDVAQGSDGRSFVVSWTRLQGYDGSDETSVTYYVDYTPTVDSNGDPDFAGTGSGTENVIDDTTKTISDLRTGTQYWIRMRVHAPSRTPTDSTTAVTDQETLDNRPVLTNLRVLTPDASTPFLIPVTFELADRNYETDRIYIYEVQYKDSEHDWQTEDDISAAFSGSISDLSAGAPGSTNSNTVYYNALRHFGTGQVSDFQLRVTVRDLEANSSSTAETSPETLFAGMSEHSSVGASFGACSLRLNETHETSWRVIWLLAAFMLVFSTMSLRLTHVRRRPK